MSSNYNFQASVELILADLINSAPPDILSKSRAQSRSNRSIKDVLKLYDPREPDVQKLIGSFLKVPTSSLLATITFLQIRHYDSVLDTNKLVNLNANNERLAIIVHNRIRSLLPHYCRDCSMYYTVPFHDTDYKKRLYCHGCGHPSHTCPTQTARSKVRDNLVWMCGFCYSTCSTFLMFLSSTPDPVHDAQDNALGTSNTPQLNNTLVNTTPPPRTTQIHGDQNNTQQPDQPLAGSTQATKVVLTSQAVPSPLPSPVPSSSCINPALAPQQRVAPLEPMSNFQLNIPTLEKVDEPQPSWTDDMLAPNLLPTDQNSTPRIDETQTAPPLLPNKPGHKICYHLQRGSCKHGISGKKMAPAHSPIPNSALPSCHLDAKMARNAHSGTQPTSAAALFEKRNV